MTNSASTSHFTPLPVELVREKHQRILAGNAPRTLDLFAGCGGITLGFDAAGFKSIGAVEFDPHAARSHATNFFRHETREQFEIHAAAKDITQIEPGELLSSLGYSGNPDQHVDVIVGGPPCQAFARVGRAKLREVADHPEAFLKDPRGNLYLRYLHYVNALKPIAILMENVPDVLNYGGHNVAEETCEILSAIGYTCRYTLLNSVFFGVPQMRERMFLIAIAADIAETIEFPEPTHWISLPKGYNGTRQVALQTVKRDLFADAFSFFSDPIEADKSDCLPAVTAQDALSDLPRITLHLEGKLKKGARRFDELTPYPIKPPTPNRYGMAMRNWPNFENGVGVTDHVIRYLPRDYAIFSRMNPGDQYPEAHAHAVELFKERLETEKAKTKTFISESSEAYKELWKATVPPYDPGKFPNKWRKMEADAPARTLMAHLGKDGYSHIHYDSTQARTISVREAARLQSFPDGFVLTGSMNPAFKQIGNAVPALLARALAEKIYSQLREKKIVKKASSKAATVV